MVDLTTEVPYEMAAGMFGRLTGIEQIDQLVTQVSKGRFRRPVLVLGVDSAYVPSRSESARGRRPDQARQATG